MVFSPAYFVNAISYLACALIALYIFLTWRRKKDTICKTGKIAGIIGFFFFIMAFINFLWSFNFPAPPFQEFIFIKTLFTVIETSLILFIVYEVTNDKKLLYLLSLFIISVIAFRYSTNNFFLIILVTAYLLVLLVSLDLAIFSNYYLKKAGIAGITFAGISLGIGGLIYLGKNPLTMPWFIPNALVFVMFIFIFLDVKNCGIINSQPNKNAKIKSGLIGPAVGFLKFTIYISSITLFIFFSTIAMHELGHALSAQFYGCEFSKAVVYDIKDYPHTEIACNIPYSNFTVTISGLLLCIGAGLLFLLTGGESTKRIAYLIFGFGLLFSYGDMTELGASKSILAIVVFSSLVIIGAGVMKLSLHYTQQQKIIRKEKNTANNVDPTGYFILHGGAIIKNLYELACSFEDMGDEDFRHHVSSEKNDFSRWVREIIKDEELAKELQDADSREKARLAVLKRLINKKDNMCIDTAKIIGTK